MGPQSSLDSLEKRSSLAAGKQTVNPRVSGLSPVAILTALSKPVFIEIN